MIAVDSPATDRREEHDGRQAPGRDDASREHGGSRGAQVVGELAAHALESGVIGAAGTLGAHVAHDTYGKVKGALQSKEADSPIVLPPGVDLDDDTRRRL